jgi:hypothetical protein
MKENRTEKQKETYRVHFIYSCIRALTLDRVYFNLK